MAQTQPAVAGRVVDAFSMRPVAGATVEAGGARAVTDADGRFALALPRGTARLLVAADGYLTDQIDVTIGDAAVMVEILLLDRAQFKETVVVTAEADRMATRPPSTIEVSPLEVRSVAGAAENVFHVLQTLPGVSATEDFGSRLAVRGGSPDQNLTIMDGVEIHDPYRLFGLTSAFNPETVENFELTSGGFGPKYGDRLSSLLLIENRAGTGTKRLAGSASLGLTDGNLVVEGRLPGGMAGSWLVTGRRTYYDLVADRITGQNLPSFGDVQAKGVWEMRPGRRLTLIGLRSRESADSQFDNSSTGSSLGFGNNARNDLVSVSWCSSLGARVTSRTIASWYRYSNALRIEGNVRNEAARSNAPGDEAFARSRVAFTREVAIRDVSVRQELGLRAGEAHLVEAGFDVHALD
ncbi:MAG: carboxypeptidase regulatory-like domain-containing protein, partial [Acidobacteria bacterium]|nr:carboxypeptidase regulatory-like domain-containing protein [Acidobacteriota bacterium]